MSGLNDRAMDFLADYITGSHITWCSVLTDTTLTTTLTTYNTYNSRKFSDYDLLVFIFGYSIENARRTIVMPSYYWQSNITIDENVLHGASASTPSSYQVCTLNVRYNSDTSIRANIGGSGAIKHLQISGAKFK